MGDNTSIEWTDATWNPIRARAKKTGKVGWYCEHASEGCRFCYAESMNAWRGTGLPFKPGHRDDVEIFLDEDILLQPLSWRAPRKIFPCSMTDLFADFVLDEWIDQIIAVMALTPHHVYQPLTKRIQRARAYFDGIPEEPHFPAARDALIEGAAQAIHAARTGEDPSMWLAVHWPLPNVWLGTSAENQPTWDERTSELRQIPAAVRFVSAEPLLGHIETGHTDGGLDGIHLVIAGGESGRNARDHDLAWSRSLRDQCAAAGVAYFQKQLGKWPIQTLNGMTTSVSVEDKKGGDPSEWPEDLRVREMPR